MRFIVLACLLIIVSLGVYAQDVPIGLQRIIDHNLDTAESFAQNISYFAAFFAGIFGILSPCILPFLPAYFSYTFKEKKDITKMTFVFFLGFTAVFVAMGTLAGYLGSQTLTVVQADWLVAAAGVYLLFMGLLSLSGTGLSGLVQPKAPTHDSAGVFFFGMSFAVGWSACVGPILAGILGLGAILHSPLKSAALLLFYSLGNLVPLFVLSLFYDRFDLSKSRFIRGRMFSYSLFGKSYSVHSTNLIAGSFFILLGLLFIVDKGTSIVNGIGGFSRYFYGTQNWLLAFPYADVLGFIVFIVFAGIVYVWVKKQ